VRVKLFMDSRDSVVGIVTVRSYIAGKDKKLFFSKPVDQTWDTHNLTFHGQRFSAWAYSDWRMQFTSYLRTVSVLRMGGAVPPNRYMTLWRGKRNYCFLFAKE
jgi:hypothetical protein